MSRSSSRPASATTRSAALVRAAAVGVMMSSVTLATTATTAGATEIGGAATSTAMDSPNSVGFQVFGMPVPTMVWLFAGVLAVLAGLIGASRSARSGAGSAPRLLPAGVDDAAFGADARITIGDADGDRS